jgi:DNA-binding NarL/FixJ family response regulator
VLPAQVLNFCREVGGRPVSPPAQLDTDDGSAPRRAMLFRSPSDQHYLIMALSLGQSTSLSGRKRVFLVVQRIGQRKSVDPTRLGQRYGLTKREQEVVARLVQGDSNKEIAASLKIQEYTVKDHLKHIMAKCQVDSRISIISKLLNL